MKAKVVSYASVITMLLMNVMKRNCWLTYWEGCSEFIIVNH